MWKNVVAMVSGGASGLGKSTVNRIVKGGGKVVIIDLPSSLGRQVAKDLGNDKTLFVPTDILSQNDVLAAIESCKNKFGYMNVLVNCTEVDHAERIFHRQNVAHSFESFYKVVNVNLIGTFNVTRLVSSEMILNNHPNEDLERGVIINTSNIAAFDGQKSQSAYAASTAGIVGMTLPIARDLADFGIRVCTIAHGGFSTPLHEGKSEEENGMFAINVPNLKRLGKPNEFSKLVEAIVFNPMLNGVTIRIDSALRM